MMFLVGYDLIKARLDWAESRIRRLDIEIANFLNQRPYKISTKVYTQSGEKITIDVEAELLSDFPLNWSFLAADAINNMRAVVDNAIWFVGRNYGVSPGFSFPVAKRHKDFPLNLDYHGRNKQAPKDLMKLPEAVRTIIEDTQPYKRGYGGNDPEYHPLAILHLLWNDDKHRLPILTSVQASLSFSHPVESGGFLIGGPWVKNINWQGIDNKVAQVSIDLPASATINPELNLNPYFSFVISFNDARPAGGYSTAGFKPAVDVLYFIHSFVRDDIIEKLKPFF